MKYNKQIPLASPNIGDAEIEAVTRVLKSRMLVQGEEVASLERAISKYLDVPHAIAVSNGTATMHLALIALGIGVGDEVIVPAFSYIATANVVELVGAKPVFVDVKLTTNNIDTALIETAITSKTKAIIPVHEFGLCCDINIIMEIAQKYNLHVIEDAACALGATDFGKKTGTFGIFGSFSLHPRKAITSGEGGIVTTLDDKLAERIRILRNHGIQLVNGKMEFVEAGFNYRMTEFQAALVRSQFVDFEEKISKKQVLANIYFQELKDIEGLILPYVPDNKYHTWQSFHIVLNQHFNRDEIISKLKDSGIGSNYGAQCIPNQIYYRNKYNFNSKKQFPIAQTLFEKGLVLPLYETLIPEDIVYICSVLKKAVISCY